MSTLKIPGPNAPLTQEGQHIEQNWKRALDDMAKALNDVQVLAQTIADRLTAAGVP